MPRTTLTKKVALGTLSTPYATPDAADLTMTAADISNLNQFLANDNDLIIVHNTGASPYTVTVTSAPDPIFGRTKDIATYSFAAGEYGVIGPLKQAGWMQSDGYVYLQASNASVKFGVVQLGAQP
jgi:hypothetical protein